jgi:hypothetical protein
LSRFADVFEGCEGLEATAVIIGVDEVVEVGVKLLVADR